MAVRTRKHLAAATVALFAVALTRVAHALDWGKPEMYGVGAGLLVLMCLVALPWIEMAPDGAWRRRPDG